MITIQVLGLDQYVIGHYSKDSTADIANILETTEDEINFYAPCDSLLFHNGVEQTSWNTVVFVKIPKKYEIFEAKLADYLLKTLKEFSINVEINFEYIAEGKSYEYVNESYPRFLTEKNIVCLTTIMEIRFTEGSSDLTSAFGRWNRYKTAKNLL